MSEQKTLDTVLGTILSDDDLATVVGGSGDGSDPVGTPTDPIDVDLKATPILF